MASSKETRTDRLSQLSSLGHPTSFLHISQAPNTTPSSNRPDSISFHRQTTLHKLGNSPTIAFDSKTPRYTASISSDEQTLHHTPAPPLSEQSDDEPPAFHPGRRFYLAFSALAALSLVVALDGTSLSVALPIIANDIGGKAIDAFWAGTSFLLASTVSLPIYAALSHIFGRKGITLVAVRRSIPSSPRSLHISVCRR